MRKVCRIFPEKRSIRRTGDQNKTMRPEKTKEERKKKFENESTHISATRLAHRLTVCEDKRKDLKTERDTSQPRRKPNLLKRAQSFASAESSIYLSKFRATRDWVFRHSSTKDHETESQCSPRMVKLQRTKSLRQSTLYEKINSFTGSKTSSGVYEDLYSLWEQCDRVNTKEDWYKWLEETENPLKVDNQR